MVVRKQKKSRKQRRSRTHGWGAVTKRRGAGHRGGRGKAGAGKRGQQKKSMYLAAGVKPIGKTGIRYKKQELALNTINVQDISLRLEKWISEGKAKKTGNKFQIDLKKLGYQKLLGAGRLDKPVEVKVNLFSKRAEEKILKAGGKIIKKEKPKPSEEKPEE